MNGMASRPLMCMQQVGPEAFAGIRHAERTVACQIYVSSLAGIICGQTHIPQLLGFCFVSL